MSAIPPICRVAGIAAPLWRDNIDTDLIIPSRAIRLQKEGMGASLFAGWRYDGAAQTENPDFVLNRPAYRQARLLIGGANFGCGSSREAAVWALKDFGIRAIIAAGFGNIFYTNCIANGLVPVALDRDSVERLAAAADGREFVVDLEACLVQAAGTPALPFALPALYRDMLLQGSAMIDVVLTREDEIAAYERRRDAQRPWLLPQRPGHPVVGPG